MAAYLSAVLAVNGQGLKTPVLNHGGRYHLPQWLQDAYMLQPLQGCGVLLWLFRGASLRLPLPKVFVPLRGQPVCRMMA